MREIMIFTKDDTIIGDIQNGEIKFLKSGRIIDFDENRDDYQKKELMHFFDLIETGIESDSDIEHAINVLKLTQGVLR